MNQDNRWLEIPQRKLGTAGLLAMLVLVSASMPISIDLYMPAVPSMTQSLATSEGMVNLTLVGYNLAFSVGLLVFGPLADRHGRKPVLLAGLSAYFVSTIICVIAPDVELLIAARVVQGLGAGAADAMTNAIVKDSFREERRQTAIAFIQLMFILGPIAAPIVGAFVVTRFSWRAAFVIIAAIGAACLLLALLFEETLPTAERAGARVSLVSQFADVLWNPAFSAFLAVFTLFNFAFMAYIAVSSYVYQVFFELSPVEYSLYFSAVAILTTLGPFAWTFASRFTTPKRFLTAVLVIALSMGAAIVTVGQSSPLAFALTFGAFAVCESSQRPLTVNTLLSQQDENVGTASSVVNFVNNAVGSAGMLAAHIPAPNYVIAVGFIVTCSMVVSLAGWTALLKSGIQIRELE